MKFTIIPPPPILQNDVECFRIAEYSGAQSVPINICPTGLSSITFQHHNGRSAMQTIINGSAHTSNIPTLFISGQATDQSVIHVQKGLFIIVILKPHALKSLLGLNACVLTDNLVGLGEFSGGDLNEQLLESTDLQEQVALLTRYLAARLNQEQQRDLLVEASLALIRKHIASITVKGLLDTLCISERQFERRFSQAVGVSPHYFIRVRRFNEAMRLMRTRRYERLTDIAYALNFYDQSHFIRDIKAFSGMTPKGLSQTVDDFHHDQGGAFQVQA